MYNAKRAQATVEYLLIIVFGLFVSIVVFGLVFYLSSFSSGAVTATEGARNASVNLILRP